MNRKNYKLINKIIRFLDRYGTTLETVGDSYSVRLCYETVSEMIKFDKILLYSEMSFLKKDNCLIFGKDYLKNKAVITASKELKSTIKNMKNIESRRERKLVEKSLIESTLETNNSSILSLDIEGTKLRIITSFCLDTLLMSLDVIDALILTPSYPYIVFKISNIKNDIYNKCRCKELRNIEKYGKVISDGFALDNFLVKE